jgi:hypothetical protein
MVSRPANVVTPTPQNPKHTALVVRTARALSPPLRFGRSLDPCQIGGAGPSCRYRRGEDFAIASPVSSASRRLST